MSYPHWYNRRHKKGSLMYIHMNHAGSSEFPMSFNRVIPDRGMTTTEAIDFLRRHVPGDQDWLCYVPESESGLIALLHPGQPERGEAAGWRWERKPIDYPVGLYHHHLHRSEWKERNWTGLLEVTSPDNESFLLFSCLSASGRIGSHYYVRPARTDLIMAFSEAIMLHLRRGASNDARIHVVNGQDIEIDLQAQEHLFMDEEVLNEIDHQVDRFYRHPEVFTRLGIPHRRGFLLVGPPGCGKTMMVRRIVRNTRAMGVTCWSINGTAHAESDMLEGLFAMASRHAPALVVMEEIDSLICESRIDRATLLGVLDGLAPRQGVLVVATTNNPLKIDPAFTHRPSRFDRVWLFKTPNYSLRLSYLSHLFPNASEHLLADIGEKTDNWSFAYLNEIRVTAAMLAAVDNAPGAAEAHIHRAHGLLAAQFTSGRKNHADWEDKQTVGFSS